MPNILYDFNFLNLTHYPMRKSLFSFSLLASLSLTACSTILNNLPGVYSVEVQQGNIIDQAMIDQLRPNMDKRQVLYIMGSPMLTDSFHKNRWDYVNSVRPSGGDRVEKKVFLVFKDVDGSDRLQGLYGDFKPSNLPFMKPPEQLVDLPKRDLERTMWEVVSSPFSDDESKTPPKETAAAKKETK